MGIVPREKKMISCDFETHKFTALFYDGFYNITGKSDGTTFHSHNFFELFFIMQGNSEVKTYDSSYSVSETDVFIIPPGCLHASISGRENLTVAGFFFSVKKKKNNISSPLDDIFAHFKAPVILKKKKKMNTYLKKIISTYYSGSAFSKDELEAFTKLIFIEILKSIIGNDVKTDLAGSFISEIPENDMRALIISEYIAQNYNRNISVKSLSSHLHLCEKYTGRIIKKSFNMSFSEYISNIRLGAAKKMLISSDTPLNKIAEEVGFKSYNGFYGFFKKKTGITPEQYRKNNSC